MEFLQPLKLENNWIYQMCRHILNENFIHHNCILLSGSFHLPEGVYAKCDCGQTWPINKEDRFRVPECPNDGKEYDSNST